VYVLAILRYRRNLDEILTVLEAHRAYLLGLREKGILLASGPLDPRTGGALLLRFPDGSGREELDRVRDGDPFVQTGMAQYEILPWNPSIGEEQLDRLGERNQEDRR
jgi:uncharacterized protein YciI